MELSTSRGQETVQNSNQLRTDGIIRTKDKRKESKKSKRNGDNYRSCVE